MDTMIMDIEETSCHHAPAKNDDVQTTVSPQTSVSDQLHTAVTLGQHSLIPQLTNRGLTPDQLNRAAATAISTSKWACVVELIKLGVDSELRDFALMKAVEQNESSYVATLARLSLGPDMVHVAKRMREAVHHGHWECVKELVSLGVSTEQKGILLTEGFTQNQWRVIPELVTVFTDPELTDLVLKEALAHNQWECVTSLINIGIDKDQMCYVCEQAAARDQWHQAFDALKKGASLSFHTTDLAFKHDRGRDVFCLLMNGSLALESSGVILQAAVKHQHWEIFSQVLRFQNFTDQQLSEALTMAMTSPANRFLKELITHTPVGVRLFKQLCLEKLSVSPDKVYDMFSYLFLELDTDLAFHLGCTQGLWDVILRHYEDDVVSKSSRQFALQRAMKQGAWVYVTKMAEKTVTDQRDRREAFAEAVRQSEWRSAMKLCDQPALTVWNGDVTRTLKTCLSLDVFDVYLEFCKRFLAAGKRSAIDSVTYAAFKAAVQARNWDFARDATKFGEISLSLRHFVGIVRKICQTQEAWETCVPVLENWCRNCRTLTCSGLCRSLVHKLNSSDTSLMKSWCLERSSHYMALLLALGSADWDVSKRVADEFGENISTSHLVASFQVAMKNDEIETAASFLQHLTPDDIDIEYAYDADSAYSLLDECRERGLTRWVVNLAITLEEWSLVESEMETCQDRSLIHHVALSAARMYEWELVNTFLSKCSEDESVLKKILHSAIEDGESRCARSLLEKVDPRVNRQSAAENILYLAVNSSGDREEMVRVCIKSGVSTHQRLLGSMYYSPLRRALKNGQLPLVRLLHESGSSSNRELYLLKKDSSIRTQLESQRRQDIVQYVDHAATNPPSLQHLSRLAVSHLVGCRPGRRDRVTSLSVPWCVQEYIMFEDLQS